MSRLCVAGVAMCALALKVAAQTEAPISIAEAVEEALQHNLALLAERSALSVADAAAITARLRPNPVLSFSADHLDWLGTGFDATNNGGPPEIAWRVDVPLERGGKRDARIAVASLVRSAAEAQFADAVRTLQQNVRLACIDLMAAQGTRALAGDTLRTFEELVRVNRARATAGSIPVSDATRSEVAMLQYRASVVRANLDVASAAARLATLLGRAPGAVVTLTDPLSVQQEPLPDVPTLEQMALRVRPDVRALQLTEAHSVADLRLQEALGRIDYTVGAEYRRQQGIAGRSNSVGLFFSAPLPISNRNQGEIARAQAERTEADRRLTALKAQVSADVRAAANEYGVALDLVSAIERDLMASATKVRDSAAYTYRAGAATLLELLDAERAFNETAQSDVDARANLRRAGARLNGAVGSEVVR